MNKRFVIGFSLFLIAAGCNPSTQNVQVQDIVELKWQSDGSALFGFIQKYTATQGSQIPGTGYDIVKFNTDGSVEKIFTNTFKSRTDFSYSLFPSPDRSTVITQLENDLYRFNINTGVLEKLFILVHLIAASPDLHYAAVSPSLANQTIKTIDVYDISVTPIRLVGHNPYVDGVASSAGIWLSNGTFGVTCNDSVGSHISIFDTTATLQKNIGGAQTPFHNVAFNAQSNDLFFTNHNGDSTNYHIDKVNLTTMARIHVLNFKVDNFDVTSDDNTIIYSTSDSIRIRNISSQNEKLITTGILRFISISPVSDNFAYINGDINFNQVRVIPFTRP